MMMSLKILSQNTKTDSITISVKALKSMAKESRKCDSLRVAYNFQFSKLQELAVINLDYFDKVEASEIKRKSLQIKLDESVKALRQKKSNWILPTALGVIGGLVGGMLLSN